MNKSVKNRGSEEMRSEYDFSKGVRGKYVDRYRAGVNLVQLDPELAEVFPDSKSVNDALRVIASAANRVGKKRARKKAAA